MLQYYSHWGERRSNKSLTALNGNSPAKLTPILLFLRVCPLCIVFWECTGSYSKIETIVCDLLWSKNQSFSKMVWDATLFRSKNLMVIHFFSPNLPYFFLSNVRSTTWWRLSTFSYTRPLIFFKKSKSCKANWNNLRGVGPINTWSRKYLKLWRD